MRREASTPRPDWPRQLEAVGFSFHSHGDAPYWSEDACYVFSTGEIDRIEAATNALHQLCLEAVDHIVTAGDLSRVGVPERYQDWVAQSWRRRDPSLYGRFDLSFDADGEPKLLEYNADTPTSLVEAAVAQWYWMETVQPAQDQFNALHDRLLGLWRGVAATLGGGARVHFTGVLGAPEDFATVEYMRDLCQQAGLATARLDISELGWNGRQFTDLQERPIATLFKLYPWEWLFAEDFGAHLMTSGVRFIEPPWKAALSNKAILAILWEMFPGHPNLLPASFNPADFSGPCVEKPLHGREGEGVRIIPGGGASEPDRIWQAYCPLPRFDGRSAVIGSWIIGDQAAGIGVRDDASEITSNLGQFVPHYFTG